MLEQNQIESQSSKQGDKIDQFQNNSASTWNSVDLLRESPSLQKNDFSSSNLPDFTIDNLEFSSAISSGLNKENPSASGLEFSAKDVEDTLRKVEEGPLGSLLPVRDGINIGAKVIEYTGKAGSIAETAADFLDSHGKLAKTADVLGDFTRTAERVVDAAEPFLKVAKPVARFLGPLAIVAGAADTAEGINQLQDAKDNGDLVAGGLKTVGGVLEVVGGTLTTTGVGAVVGAPLEFVGGLITTGVDIAENREQIVDTAEAFVDGAKDVAGDVVDGAKDVVGGAKKVFDAVF